MFAVLGPTASGKSRLAEAVAERFGAVLVSVDSMQVYRGMDIGTAKPDADTRRRFDYRMIDVADAAEDYDVARYQREGRIALDQIAASNRSAVVVGGSGLYFRALVDPLEFPPTDAAVRAELEAMAFEDRVAELVAADPDAGTIIDLANPRRVLRAVEIHRITGRTPSERRATAGATAVRSFRPERSFVAVGVDPGERLVGRVMRRFDEMLDAGLLAEVEELAPSLGLHARQAVGYKELLPVTEGRRTIDEARRLAIAATTALAKRQRTFFRRDPRIRWLPWQDGGDERFETVVGEFEEGAAWTS